MGVFDGTPGKHVEKATNFCDTVFEFLERNTRLLEKPRCGAFIKQRLQDHVAKAKNREIERRKRPPEREPPQKATAEKEPEKPKKKKKVTKKKETKKKKKK